MTQEVKEMLKSIMALSDSEKVELAQGALKKLFDGLEDGGVTDDDTKVSIMLTLVKLFISADKNCAADEYSFFIAVTGLSKEEITYEHFYNLTNGGSDSKFKAEAFEILKILNAEDRTSAIIFGAAILSCDDKFDLLELKLIDEILSL